MNTLPLRGLFLAGVFAGLATVTSAQVVQFNATINGAQETPPTTSPATGYAVMMYDVSKNTYDLIVTVNNLANTIANSHIHEAASGTAGSVVVPFGGESLYTRSGNTVMAEFKGTYTGNPKTLLSGGAYYNIHTSQYPGGEVRGQLVPQPKRLTAIISAAAEQAAQPAGTTINSNAWGAAVVWYDPVANTVSTRINLFNFTNTLTNSHFHEAAAGTSGGVVTPLGGASVYTANGNGSYSGTFDNTTYGGNPITLLSGGSYVNFHSNVYPGGEIRGQVLPDDEVFGTGVVNVSTRGNVSSTEGIITGFSIQGPEPVQLLITAKGPSLAAYGIATPLSDPTFALYDGTSHWIGGNNDVGTPAAGSDLAKAPGVPTNPVESAMTVVLPPGHYTVVATGNGGATGEALVEVTNARVFGR